MIKNKKVSKRLSDVSITKFIDMLEYKSELYGKSLIKINRYYPSSQICNHCLNQNKEIKDLSIRNWTCPNCGKKHDR